MNNINSLVIKEKKVLDFMFCVNLLFTEYKSALDVIESKDNKFEGDV